VNTKLPQDSYDDDDDDFSGGSDLDNSNSISKPSKIKQKQPHDVTELSDDSGLSMTLGMITY
jgi:hypothetical protein